jgi:LmbE family N-acetylglucosaminyl deacetylase
VAAPSPVDTLPPDTGGAGLKQVLVRLQTTARLMQTTAHPDDEDGGMLTLESRGHGVTTLLMTLTRGEGGQNKVGSNLFDVLGVLRALELTASDRYYGVEQRFSRVADFGYSKNPEETFQKWGGHDIALGDMVRVIRTFRPDVLVARFSGTERDGHGHHQASAILPRKPLRSLGPESVSGSDQEGLQPWQAKAIHRKCVRIWGDVPPSGKLYRQAEYWPGESSTADVIHPVRHGGLRHQLSQGAADGLSNRGIALPITS